MPDVNLVAELVPEGVDHREVLDVILRHYGGAESSDPYDEIRVPRDCEDRPALTIRTAKGRIVGIERGPQLTDEEVEKLKGEIADKLLGDHGQAIAAHIFFSSLSVKGCFRCEVPPVQMIEAPAEAPRPNQSMGEHPFIVEFPLALSNDLMIKMKRRGQRAQEWANVFNLLLTARITCLTGRGERSWVRTESGEVIYAQHFYDVPDFPNERDDFSVCSELIPEIAHSEYYTDWYSGDILSVPDSLGKSLSLVGNLPEDDRETLLRGARWFSAASAVWGGLQSSAYIALVTAIETLVPPSPPDRCPECGLDRSPGATARFKDFLDRYVPGSRGAALYRMRSKLGHGGYMLTSDMHPHGSFESGALQEWKDFQLLYRSARSAIINWLFDH